MKKLLLLAITLVSLLSAGCAAKGTIPPIPAVPQNAESPAIETPCPAPCITPLEIAEPTLPPPEAIKDDPLLVLVDFSHPIVAEPPVVTICDRLTAGNVYCDPRRHANEEAVKALNEMLLAAESEGEFHFIIASAFRSIEEQTWLWNGRISEDPDYGSDPYSRPVKTMPPNCSEHTTGLAFDILCDSCPHGETRFADTPEGRWLAQNAHRFGFILRYPEDKRHITGVQYEPWHFRYVGKEAAEHIFSHSLCLEEYLGETGGR